MVARRGLNLKNNSIASSLKRGENKSRGASATNNGYHTESAMEVGYTFLLCKLKLVLYTFDMFVLHRTVAMLYTICTEVYETMVASLPELKE